jgi:5-methylcytosine-specific restriction endonuclease McrA
MRTFSVFLYVNKAFFWFLRDFYSKKRRHSSRAAMERTLLLNATFEPLKIISWQRAITLLTQGKVEVIDFYDRDVRGVSITFKLPSILRLLKLVKIKRTSREVRFSRANIYQRDKYTCQYCGVKYPAEDLTFDHVIPQVQGGEATWENIVTACLQCNNRKGGRTPREAKMRLIRPPVKPRWMPVVTLSIGIKNAPLSWRDYLYWNVELNKEG